MTKYQSAVIWLGLALIFVRFLTTGQRSLFSQIIGATTNTASDVITPAQETATLTAQLNSAVTGNPVTTAPATVSTGTSGTPTKPGPGPTPHG